MSLFLASLGFGLVTAAVLAFAAYALNQAGVNVWIAMLAAAAAGAAGSVLLNRGIYTPFQRRGSAPITMVIVSLGMSLIIEFGLQAIMGGTNVSFTMSQGPTVKAGGLTPTAVQLVIIGLSVVGRLAVHGLLRYAKLGKAMRATAANRSLARNCGIRTDRVVTATGISAAYLTPSYKDVIAFLVLLVVMAVRPGGVLGATA